MNSPISIDDSEEEVVQELTYSQFYQGSSTQGADDYNNVARQPSQRASYLGQIVYFILNYFSPLELFLITQGKRKRQEEDQAMAGPSNDSFRATMSLENRISQPESKKAKKRRRKAEKLALEQQRQQNTDNANAFLPVRPLASQLSMPSLQARLETEHRRSEPNSLHEITRHPGVEGVKFHDDLSGLPRLPPIPSASNSDWVSSMVMASGSKHIKAVETVSQQSSISPHISFSSGSTPPPEILPPIRINMDLIMTTQLPIQTQTQTLPQTPQSIGMKPEQDPNSKHGIFHVTESTTEAGTAQKKRKSQYIPNPARTLVMEQLPKTHRTIRFVGNWCLTACGVPALHLFIDPPSAKALVEFATADLARKAWASPRLGQDLFGIKSHLLKGKAREDLIKVWWYRVDGIGAGAGVGELEEGEIEGDAVVVRETQLPLPEPPRKETKAEKKVRLAKEREQKMVKEMQQKMQHLQPQDKKQNIAGSSALGSSAPHEERTEILQVHIPLPSAPHGVSKTFSQSHLPPRPKVPTLPPAVQKSFELPIPQPWQYSRSTSIPQPQPSLTEKAVGASLPPSSRGGYDDSASIASSDGRSSPLPAREGTASFASSSKVVLASTIGQADDLADYEELDMDVDVGANRKGKIGNHTIPPAASSTAPVWSSAMLVSEELDASTPVEDPPISLLHSVAGRHFSAESKVNGNVVQNLPSLQQNQLRLQLQPQVDGASAWATTKWQHSNAPSSVSFASSSSAIAPSAKGIPAMKDSASTNLSMDFAFPSPCTPHLVPTMGPFKKEANAKASLPTSSSFPRAVFGAAMEPPDAATTNFLSHALAPAVSRNPKFLNADSEGHAIEENLRQLVFASKKRFKVTEPRLPQLHTSTSSEMSGVSATGTATPTCIDYIQTGKADVVFSSDSSLSVPSTPTIPPPNTLSTVSDVNVSTSSKSFSFEDLAVSFITQTIENVKANPQSQFDHPPAETPLSSVATSTSTTPPLHTPAVGLPGPSSAVANMSNGVPSAKLPRSSSNNVVSELAARQKRLERHIQESKVLMERISTAKTKQEKDVLLKIMRENTRCVVSVDFRI